MSNPNALVTLTLLDFPANTPLQQWSFDRKMTIRVGRAADNEVVVEHGLVSRYHLEIFANGRSAGILPAGRGHLARVFSHKHTFL